MHRPQQNLTGRVIGHYRIQEKLGEGGMGAVYRAVDTRLGRTVALKVLTASKMGRQERVERFLHEARSASALNHPNIVTIYDIGSEQDIEFIAMEYVPGKTLHELIGHKPLPLSSVLWYACQIADALAAAHAAGIIHRDLKPANIMVTESGLVKVLDFGLAKLVERNAEQADVTMTLESALRTMAGTAVGTAAYMSPEQAEGKKLNARSDIFSFGIVLYEMTTGQRPFRGETQISTLASILEREPTPVSEVIKNLPGELERIIARCLRKDPEKRIQHMDDVRLALEEVKIESDSSRPRTLPQYRRAPRRRGPLLAAAIGAVLLIALGTGAAVWRLRTQRPATEPVQVRLTTDSGLTTGPAISSDGKVVAYASDRSGEGHLDIWMHPVAGGEPVRLTHDSADADDPCFSPDGRSVAFRSEREGGGIEVVSVSGGSARRIAAQGRNPRFSPDGNWVAYWVGHAGGGSLTRGNGKIFVVPVGGGPPRQLAPEFFANLYPVWTPDGGHILFLGNRDDARDSPNESADWWVMAFNPGEPAAASAPVRTGAFETFRAQGFGARLVFIPGAWLGERMVFSALLGDRNNLWQAPFSRNWKAGAATHLTSGTTLEIAPAAAGSMVAFASVTENIDIWSLPADTNHGKTTGALQRLTEDAASDIVPSVSADGRRLAFVSARTGAPSVWMKDLTNGRKEAQVATMRASAPVLSADGARVAWESLENQKWSIYVAATSGSVPERVCTDCGQPSDWTSDNQRVLYVGRSPARVSVLDVISGRKTPLLDHPTFTLYQPRLSPDGRWLAFLATGTGRSRVCVVALRNAPEEPPAAAADEWISITEGDSWEDKPRWSPDGNLLYFTSERDGFRCIWARRLDPSTKRPRGAPFAVFHSHTARLNLMNVGLGPLELAVARDKLVFNMAERTGNIWMAKK